MAEETAAESVLAGGPVSRKDGIWVETGALGSYSDVEGRENEILDELKKRPWLDVVREKYHKSNPWLYSIITDRGRGLFLEMLPLPQEGNFLDVGSGWGQAAIPLAKRGLSVFCLDISEGRLSVLREIARQEGVAPACLCGNFLTYPLAAERFDGIIFNGSLEWIALGHDGPVRALQEQALAKAFSLLKPGGLLYIGIENALGLKYVLGSPDDHTCLPYVNILDFDEANARHRQQRQDRPLRARTWTLADYRRMLEGAGFAVSEVYGCFPDYKIIRDMVPLSQVNKWLLAGRLNWEEHDNGLPLACAPLLKPLYKALAANGAAELFCPSYGIAAVKPAGGQS
ncbi:MAG: class I SAM-dependent methyltransferase [Elusimicrobiales bacterium]